MLKWTNLYWNCRDIRYINKQVPVKEKIKAIPIQ